MRSILTSTALATVLAFGLAAGSGVVRAQDAQPQMNECIGENCPGGGGAGSGEKMKQPEQDTQMNEQSGEGTMPRKKKRMGTQDTDVDADVKTQTGEETITRKKKRVGVQQDVDVDVNARIKTGDTRWRFDPNRHRRSKSKSATFRFYFNGYYYPEPYWTEVHVLGPGRISCGAGRAIVAERFNRVRVVECRGGTYTYIGRRAGETYRILLNSRSGRIVGRAAI